MNTPELARSVIAALKERGLTVAACESLTGGLICATLVDVPGASAVVRGGFVTYQTDTKTLLADVPAALIAEKGVVSADVARAMAEGARRKLGTDIAVSATGMASPGGLDEPPAGTVFVGLSTATGVQALPLQLTGTRLEIRQQTVHAALQAILTEVTHTKENPT